MLEATSALHRALARADVGGAWCNGATLGVVHGWLCQDYGAAQNNMEAFDEIGGGTDVLIRTEAPALPDCADISSLSVGDCQW